MYTLSFTDVHLQKCYDSNLAVTDDLAQDLRQIRALIATSVLFRMLDGPHSVRVQEILECLISPELRPALRSWYQRPATEKERLAMEFRNELNQLTGEQLEISSDHLTNMSRTRKLLIITTKEPACDVPRELKPKNQ